MKYVFSRLIFKSSTFFTGILMIAFGAFITHSKAVEIEPILASDSSKTGLHTNNKNDIDIEYAWSLIGVESLDGSFYVTNNTSESIRYSANNFGQSNPFRVKQNGKTKIVNLPYFVGADAAKEQELKPNESTILFIPMPQNDKPFEAGFNFLVGVERKERIVWVKVEKQLKSFGLTCTDEIKKAGGVLSKTCLTPMPRQN